MGQVAVREHDSFGTATAEDIERSALRLGRPLPRDYRDFLLWTNGGRPVNNVCVAAGTDVHWIFGLNEAPAWSSLWSTIDTYAGRLPADVMPVASDSGGNLFVLESTGDAGRVLFWDHEAEFDRDGGGPAFVVVASGFAQFLEELVPA